MMLMSSYPRMFLLALSAALTGTAPVQGQRLGMAPPPLPPPPVIIPSLPVRALPPLQGPPVRVPFRFPELVRSPVPRPNLAPARLPIQTARPVIIPAGAPSALSWDSESKEYSAEPGETAANFTFLLTNTSPSEVVITGVRTSCGCTVAKLPSQPWHLSPGSDGQIDVTVDLRGKYGTVTKTITVSSSIGWKLLLVKVHIPAPQGQGAIGAVDMDRMRNLRMATANRQIVFRSTCAECHAKPAQGKLGKELYEAACGICHDSPHRASMVPDLQALNHPVDLNFWRTTISVGKPGTLMPAFATEHGGILNSEQINSLASYLAKNFKSAPGATSAVTRRPDARVLPAPTPVVGNDARR